MHLCVHGNQNSQLALQSVLKEASAFVLLSLGGVFTCQDNVTGLVHDLKICKRTSY